MMSVCYQYIVMYYIHQFTCLFYFFFVTPRSGCFTTSTDSGRCGGSVLHIFVLNDVPVMSQSAGTLCRSAHVPREKFSTSSSRLSDVALLGTTPPPQFSVCFCLFSFCFFFVRDNSSLRTILPWQEFVQVHQNIRLCFIQEKGQKRLLVF